MSLSTSSKDVVKMEGNPNESQDFVPSTTQDQSAEYPSILVNAMDIDDIVATQPETNAESTLESEIDALSKIITDTKDSIQKLEDSDEVFKLDTEDIGFNTSLQSESLENDKFELTTIEDAINKKHTLDHSKEVDNLTSDTTLEQLQAEPEETKNQQIVKENSTQQEQNQKEEIGCITVNYLNETQVSEILIHKEPFDLNDSTSSKCEIAESDESQHDSIILHVPGTELNAEITRNKTISHNIILESMIADVPKEESDASDPSLPDAIQVELKNSIDDQSNPSDSCKESESGNLVSEKNELEKDVVNKEELSKCIDQVSYNLNINEEPEGTEKSLMKPLNNESEDSKQQEINLKNKEIEDKFKIHKESQLDNVEKPLEKVQEQNTVSDTLYTKEKDILETDEKQLLSESPKNIEENVIVFKECKDNNIKECILESKCDNTIAINITEQNNLMFKELDKNSELNEILNDESPKTINETIEHAEMTENNELATEKINEIVVTQIIKVTNTDKNIELPEDKEDESHSQNIKVTIVDEKVLQQEIESNDFVKDLENTISSTDTHTVLLPDTTTQCSPKTKLDKAECLEQVKIPNIQDFEMFAANTARELETINNKEINTEILLINEVRDKHKIEYAEVIEDATILQHDTKDTDSMHLVHVEVNDSVQSLQDAQCTQESNTEIESVKIKDIIFEDSHNPHWDKKIEEIDASKNDNIANTKKSLVSNENKEKDDIMFEKVDNVAIENFSESNSENATQLLMFCEVDRTETKEELSSVNDNLTFSKEEVDQVVSDLNDTELFKESDILEETEVNRIIKESEFNKEIEVDNEILPSKDIPEQIVSDVNKEAIEHEGELNLSINSEVYHSPVAQNLNDESMLDVSLNELIDTQNSNNVDEEKNSCTEQDVNKILNANDQEEVRRNNNLTDVQKLALNDLKEVEPSLESDLNELLNIESDITEETFKNYTNKIVSNSQAKEIASLDTLTPEVACFEEDKEEIETIECGEKEEDITLELEESSQSPREVQSDKLSRDLYENDNPFGHTAGSKNEVENITKCNESESIAECNVNNVEMETVDYNDKSSEMCLETQGNEQLNDKEILESPMKNIDDMENDEIPEEPSTEISEIESAVKFLQESVEQDIKSSKLNEDVTISEENSSIFVSVEDNVCDAVSELGSELPEMIMDPIAISEAEIISEAAKLENERKETLDQTQHLKTFVQETNDVDSIDELETSALSATNDLLTVVETHEHLTITHDSENEEESKITLVTGTNITSESHPTAASLDEHYKEPPKIEIPEISPKMSDLPISSKSSLLIQRDVIQRLESPDRSTVGEPKIADTPKKDVECENVGSPRIILKIAKSALTECSEPRSPKSPKIRSATNSPNPEDSPGQKLGKIKLKLLKGGHPSIIPSSDSYEETSQWHTDSTASLSPLGMKIKLSKTGDASVVESKHEEQDEPKEKSTHKTEETRKLESSIGMKIKLSKSGDASIVQDTNTKESFIHKHKENKETGQVNEASSSKKQDSPSIGMKIKLSKSGDASIIQQDNKPQSNEENKDFKIKDKICEDIHEIGKRTESPIGMKIKLSKSGDASVIPNEIIDSPKETPDTKDRMEEPSKRTDSPIGVKIKLAKTKDGSASIISTDAIEDSKEKFSGSNVESTKKIKISKKKELAEELSDPCVKIKEKLDIDLSKQHELNKIKITKVVSCENDVSMDFPDEVSKTGLGMKIKLSKCGDASVVHTTKEDMSIGMKIKLSKTGDPSIISSDVPIESEDETFSSKNKHGKSKDLTQQKSKDDVPLEMKIKLSKTGHPTIITTNEIQEDPLKLTNIAAAQSDKQKDSLKESTLKNLKKSHSDVTIESVKSQSIENAMIDLHNKRKEITIAPIESKKSKIEANFKQMLPDVTIQPIIPSVKKEQQQKLLLESNNGSISRQQMNVINQEISITQICSLATGATLMGEHLKSALNLPNEPSASSPLNSDCEIIEPQPELIIVNENSNSSQDIMIIDEVPPAKLTKVPKKRGRPRRNANIATGTVHSVNTKLIGYQDIEMQRDPLSLDQPSMGAMSQIPMQASLLPHIIAGSEGSERPRRTCRSQKSYAPPKRGRGRGRGKRKNESLDIPLKRPRIEQDLTAIEASTTAMISIEKLPVDITNSPTDLFNIARQPSLERITETKKDIEILSMSNSIETTALTHPADININLSQSMRALDQQSINIVSSQEKIQEIIEGTEELKMTVESQAAVDISSSTKNLVISGKVDNEHKLITSVEVEEERTNKEDGISDKDIEKEDKQSEIARDQSDMITESGKDGNQEHQHWLAPSIRKVSSESTSRTESISTLTVIDEETRMSAESNSRSQTPARNISVPGTSETLVNEESQGSVLSTATTESEKVKVKIRRMEINFDPDEGPFTVDKIAEYEWPLDKKEERPAARGETLMIQEQISQYLGVKSFKRKYPDLKRRTVDMEERNFLRENGLVSESLCDMGLTAVSSSEVLDIMCSDFPEQYEEYRKHMREKAAKEHSKKQKELSAAANAERNRIDLAEMAMQSALSWNSNLNKTRRDTRKCSLDLQTFTVHMPKRPAKFNPARRGSHYPVALIPGQYTDYYREYTPAELRYYPLNTVLYGPMRPNERKFDSQSEGSQSDSDSDSSSDDSSTSSSEGTQDTEGSQSTMDEVDMELALQSDIKCKMCSNNLNKSNRPEVLIQCGTCNGNVHPSCIDLTLDMVPHIRAYAWQCTDCKTCAQCHDPADEDKMLFCDMCDRGYHIYCVGLRRVPQGRWHCQECAVCANCGSKEPGGANSDRNSVAQWQHEYKKGDKNTRVYVSTFCVPCSKLWRKGRYCPHCSRCHNAPRLDLEPNLVHCGACDKFLHLGCVETKGVIIDKKHYLCEFCSPNRQQLVKPLMSKTFKT